MTTLKSKDIQKMSKKDREKKLKELKLELIKSRVNASKTGNSNTKEIKKIIARILTLNKRLENDSSQSRFKSETKNV